MTSDEIIVSQEVIASKEVLCRAKINLHLNVGQKYYEDGREYHQILTLLQDVFLSDGTERDGDRLSLSLKGRVCASRPKISVRAVPEPCAEQDNLVYRATQLYLNHLASLRVVSKWPQNISFHLKKRIPKQAGLAGGSSNAAVALQLLNEALPLCVGVEPLASLHELAASLGSDITFFLQDASARVLAWASGRGERIHHLKPRCRDILHNILQPFQLCLVKAQGVDCPTAQMYQLFAEKQSEKQSIVYSKQHLEQQIEELEDKYTAPKEKIRALSKLLQNDFFVRIQDCLAAGKKLTDVQQKDFRVLASLYDYLYSLAASWVALSGSGSAFFAFFPPELSYDEIERKLKAFVVPLECYPAQII